MRSFAQTKLGKRITAAIASSALYFNSGCDNQSYSFDDLRNDNTIRNTQPGSGTSGGNSGSSNDNSGSNTGNNIGPLPDYWQPRKPASAEECRRAQAEFKEWKQRVDDEKGLLDLYNSWKRDPTGILDTAAEIIEQKIINASGLEELVKAVSYVNEILEEINFCDWGHSGPEKWADIVADISDTRLNKYANEGVGEADLRSAIIDISGDFITYGFTDVGAIRGPGVDIRVYFQPANGTAFVGLVEDVLEQGSNGTYVSVGIGGEQEFRPNTIAPSRMDIDLDDYPKFQGQLDEIVTDVYIGNKTGLVKIDAVEVLNTRDVNALRNNSGNSGGSGSSGDPYVDDFGYNRIAKDGQNAIGAPDGQYAVLYPKDQGLVSYVFTDNTPKNGSGDDIILHLGPVSADIYRQLQVSISSNSGYLSKEFTLSKDSKAIGVDIAGMQLGGPLHVALITETGSIKVDAIESRYNE